MTGPAPRHDTADEAFHAGFLAGIEHGTATGHAMGHAEGYRAAMTVLDEAGALLASTRPSNGIDVAAARARRTTYTTPARTPEEILAHAARSWGLPIPQPAITEAVSDSAEAAEAVDVAELVDDDDWAWP